MIILKEGGLTDTLFRNVEQKGSVNEAPMYEL